MAVGANPQIADSNSLTIEELREIPLSRRVSFDPSKKVRLSWNELNVFVKPKASVFSFLKNDKDKQMRQLLHDVNGEVLPGTLMAIMGASGAGKTTLMNVLTGRNVRQLQVEGEVLVNGKNLGVNVTRVAAYVQQDDLFIGSMTVREHLTFQALLRMDKDKTLEERMERVEEVIFELGLGKCENTMIGIPAEQKGISGGERKRLSFASEVLTNPSLMFCDEPTSGLDSFMSQNIVQVLRELACGGRTVVFTIHQPSSELFQLFDHLLLLAEGRIAFQGRASDAIGFFERAGLRCPINFNPTDFFIYNLAIIPGKEVECRSRIADIVAQYQKENAEPKNRERTVSKSSYMETSVKDTSKYKASWCRQFRALTWRCWISMMRDRFLTKVRIIQSIIVGLIFGLVYYDQQVTETGVMNINGAIFLILLTTNVRNMVAVANSFCAERSLFFREHWNGMYRVDVYFLCKSVVEIPLFTVQVFFLIVITYWMIGLQNNITAFLYFVLIIMLTVHASISFGYLISCIAPNINVATNIGTTLVMPLQLFGGFYLNTATIPSYLDWIKYLSWFYYGNEALVVNQWNNIKNITCESTFCEPTGQAVLDKYNFHEDNFMLDIALTVALIIFYRVLAYAALFIRASRKT